MMRLNQTNNELLIQLSVTVLCPSFKILNQQFCGTIYNKKKNFKAVLLLFGNCFKALSVTDHYAKLQFVIVCCLLHIVV